MAAPQGTTAPSSGGNRVAVLAGYSYRRSLAYTDGSGRRIRSGVFVNEPGRNAFVSIAWRF